MHIHFYIVSVELNHCLEVSKRSGDPCGTKGHSQIGQVSILVFATRSQIL